MSALVGPLSGALVAGGVSSMGEAEVGEGIHNSQDLAAAVAEVAEEVGAMQATALGTSTLRMKRVLEVQVGVEGCANSPVSATVGSVGGEVEATEPAIHQGSKRRATTRAQ